MPIEPSEVELIIQLYLQKLMPNLTDHKGEAEALSKEIEIVVRPVIEKLERDKNTAEHELDLAQGELYCEQQYCTELREQIEDMEEDEEWDKMVKQFWYYCERT